MNLDGGGSTTLVHRGRLLNRPYGEQDQPTPTSRPIVAALLLDAAAWFAVASEHAQRRGEAAQQQVDRRPVGGGEFADYRGAARGRAR